MLAQFDNPTRKKRRPQRLRHFVSGDALVDAQLECKEYAELLDTAVNQLNRLQIAFRNGCGVQAEIDNTQQFLHQFRPLNN